MWEETLAGRRLTQVDQINRTRSFTYDAMGRTLTETDPRGGVTRHVYDSLGRETTITDALNGVTRMAWDNAGNKTADVDALGRRTTHSYDGENRKTLTTYPDSATMGATYNFRGDKLTETDQLGRVTRNEYDRAGQLITVTKAFGTAVAGTVRYTYDLAGRKLTETDERGNVTTFGYDDVGRQTRMTNALGQVTQYGYDAAGQRMSMTDANARVTRYAFDARRRMTTTTFVDNTTIRHTYDGMGRQLTTTDQSGRVTSKGYDDAGQLVSVTDALNQITRYGYDGNGNLISQTDAAGRITAYQWDALNRRTRRTLPMGMFETASYDAVGNTTSRVDFNGRTTTYLYDTLNRLTRKTPDASFFAAPVHHGYLANGLRASMNDVSGATSYSYDARNRLVTKTTPQGALSYGYDARGNVTSMQSSNANGTWVNYSHDSLNRLASVVDRRLPSGTTTYSYNLVGNQGRVVYPNGVQHEYVYDALERLTSLPITGSGLLDRHNYSVAPTGHRSSTTRLNGRTSTYGYDATYKLVQEIISGDPTPTNNGSITYGYDAVGNRLSLASTLGAIASRTYGYDLNDRLNGDTYDANGNTLTSGGTSYLYDFEDRLIRANTVNLLYDGDGNRVRKTAGANATSYLVDDLNPTGYSQVVDEIVNGGVQRTYTYGLQRISQNWPAPSLVPNFYVYDGHGSVRALTDAAGVVTDAYEFDAFGNFAATAGTTVNNNFYTGEYFDSDLGNYYLRARWYRPSIGRFLTSDPWEGSASDPLSRTRYLYSGNDPANKSDPTGMLVKSYPTWVGVLVVGAVVYSGMMTTVDYGPLVGQQLSRGAKWVYCILTAVESETSIAASDNPGGEVQEAQTGCGIQTSSSNGPDPACPDLRRQIEDLRNELVKRWEDLKEDKLKLPLYGKNSICGHIQQYLQSRDAYARSSWSFSAAIALEEFPRMRGGWPYCLPRRTLLSCGVLSGGSRRRWGAKFPARIERTDDARTTIARHLDPLRAGRQRATA